MSVNIKSLVLEEVHLIGEFLFEAIFINKKKKKKFYLVSFRLLFAAGFVGLALTRRRWSETFPFSRTVTLPILTPVRRSLQQTVGERSQGKTNVWFWIDENRFKLHHWYQIVFSCQTGERINFKDVAATLSSWYQINNTLLFSSS